MYKDLLKHKRIIVTGASSGIGKVIAILFSQLGAQIVITGRNTERLDNTFSQLSNSNHLAITSSLSDPISIEELIKSTYQKIGPLDALVHCAGIQKTLPIQSIKEEQFDDIFNSNVKSAQFLLKSFRKKGRYNINGSSIVFLSSVAAQCGEPAISTYSASKAALEGLSKSAAIELARQSIRVNCIAPGHVETEMSKEFSKQLTKEQYEHILSKHPLGLGKPEDVANAAAFLVSNLSSWITGTTMKVDGGYSAQ